MNNLLSFVNGLPLELSLVIFFFTAAVLVLIRDWRISVAAMLLQYVALGAALLQMVQAEIALAKLLVGLLICPMLYLSARQASWRHQLTLQQNGLRALLGQRTLAGEVFPPGRTFRLFALMLLGIAAFSVGEAYPIFGLPPLMSVAVYWLVATGGLILMLTEEPLKIGQGLLTALTGFDLWYANLESSLLLVGIWGAVNLLTALVIGYLTTVRGVNLEEDF